MNTDKVRRPLVESDLVCALIPDPDLSALDAFASAAGISRSEAARQIINEWLIANSYLPLPPWPGNDVTSLP